MSVMSSESTKPTTLSMFRLVIVAYFSRSIACSSGEYCPVRQTSRGRPRQQGAYLSGAEVEGELDVLGFDGLAEGGVHDVSPEHASPLELLARPLPQRFRFLLLRVTHAHAHTPTQRGNLKYWDCCHTGMISFKIKKKKKKTASSHWSRPNQINIDRKIDDSGIGK